MDQLFGALFDLTLWMEEITPLIPLVALPLLAGIWLAAGWAIRVRERPSRAIGLARLWAAMLALSCLLLAAWAASRGTTEYGPEWLRRTSRFLLVAALAPAAHGLRTTLLRLTGPPGGGDRGADNLRFAAWAVFAAVTLLLLHAIGMAQVFPFGGGAFHAMFAYSEGNLPAAFGAWRASVLILGAAAIAFPLWIPLRWWIVSIIAIVIGVLYWRLVVAWSWSPVSPEFHRTAVRLLVAHPFAILALSAAGMLARRAVGRRRSAADA